jgi:hypothetical protein
MPRFLFLHPSQIYSLIPPLTVFLHCAYTPCTSSSHPSHTPYILRAATVSLIHTSDSLHAQETSVKGKCRTNEQKHVGGSPVLIGPHKNLSPLLHSWSWPDNFFICQANPSTIPIKLLHPSSIYFYSEDGGIKFFQNFGNHLHDYKVSEHR